MTITADRGVRTQTDTQTDLSGPALSALGLVTVLGGQFLAILDFFIVNVALPAMGTQLHAGRATEELIVAGYGLSYALGLVLGGRLGDTWGRKRMFLLGMALFTVSSLACGLAPDAVTLVATRVVQGGAAALMVPQVLGTITATTDGAVRARALGLFGATNGIASIIAQLAGGALVAADVAGLGWRPIFLVNVPFGVLALLAALRWMPATRARERSRVDVRGTVLLAATLLVLLVPLLEGQALGWPWWIIAPVALVPLAAWWFLRVQRAVEARGGSALLSPSLLRTRSLRTGLFLAVPFFLAFGGFSFGYVVALQQGLGFTPMECGLAFAPLGVTFLAASLSAPRLVARFGSRVLRYGIAVQLLGFTALALTLLFGWPHLGVLELAPCSAVLGVGNGLVMGPPFRVVLTDVPAHRAGTGSGLLSTTQQVSLALGVAVLGTVFGAFGTGGMRDGMVALLAVAAALSVVFAVGSRRLPDPR